jgi:uncharacterized membrane protein required for colicin V production
MTSGDILLLLIVAGAFLFGFFWGVIRGLLGLAGFFIVFVLSAYVSQPVGDFLAQQWTQYPASYDHMLANLLVFAVFYTLTLVAITLGTRGTHDLSRFRLVDDVLGALLGASLAVLSVAAVTAILRTFYGPFAPPSGQGAEWTANVYRALLGSTFGGQISDSVVPAIVALIGGLLPADIRRLI